MKDKIVVVAESRQAYIEELLEREIGYLEYRESTLKVKVKTSRRNSSPVEQEVLKREKAMERIQKFLDKYEVIIAKDEEERERIEEEHRKKRLEGFWEGFKEWKESKEREWARE